MPVRSQRFTLRSMSFQLQGAQTWRRKQNRRAASNVKYAREVHPVGWFKTIGWRIMAKLIKPKTEVIPVGLRPWVPHVRDMLNGNTVEARDLLMAARKIMPAKQWRKLYAPWVGA